MHNTVGELCESSGGFGALILIFEVVEVYLKGMERFKIGFSIIQNVAVFV
jgi:hypothetical protein